MDETKKVINLKQHSNKPEVISFEKAGVYHFTVKEKISNKHRKTVYVGSFNSSGEAANDSAPQGCKLDTLYCLKRSNFSTPFKNHRNPQSREYLDYLPYEGDNLREILCMNNDTEALVNAINNGTVETEVKTYDCIIIEPLYAPFDVKYFPSVSDKFDCLLQVIAGLKQLNAVNFDSIKEILAHRDLKFQNIVIDTINPDKNTVKLIDFSSVKIGNMSTHSEHTVESALSPSNTAPEDIFTELQVSEKTDVFALGMMMAEIFSVWSKDGICNPLQILLENDSINLANMKVCKRYYNDLLTAHKENELWLEHLLSNTLTANWEIENSCEGFRELFRKATRLHPENRCTLSEFEESILKFKNQTANQDNLNIEQSKFEIYLFDSVEFNKNRTLYLEKLKSIYSEPSEAVIIFYGAQSENSIQQIQCCLKEISSENITSFTSFEKHLYQTDSPVISGFSQLTGALLSTVNYLKDKKRAERFNGKIHIFSSKPPIQNHLCTINYPDETALGGTRILTLSAREIVQMLPCSKIAVYSHSDELENWYDFYPLTEESKEETIPKAKENNGYFVIIDGKKLYL